MPMNKAALGWIYRIAHDLSAPLRQVRAFSDMLEEDWGELETEKRTEYLKIIARQSRLAEQMLAAMTKLTTIPEHAGEHTPLNLTDLFTSFADTTPLEVHADIPEDLMVSSHAATLKDVIKELAANAVAHGNAKSWSVFLPDTTTSDASRKIAVQDDGIGLEEADWQAYQVPFVSAKGKPNLERLGMGLPVVMQLAASIGVAIAYRPSGKGLLLELTFPASALSQV